MAEQRHSSREDAQAGDHDPGHTNEQGGHNRDAEDRRETNRPVRPVSGGSGHGERLPRGGAR